MKGFRRLGPAGPLAVIAASSPTVSGFLLLASMPFVAPWMRAHPAAALSAFVGVYVVLGGLALMPTYAYSVLAGWAFGFAVGFPAAMGAYVGAGVIGYAIGRRASGDRALEMVREHPKLQAVCDALIGSGFGRTLLIVTLLRLPPNSPFAVTNLTMAAMRVNPVAYVIGSLVGLAPRTAAVVFVSQKLSEPTVDQPHSTWMWVGSIAATLLVLGVIGYISNQALAHVTGAKTGAKTRQT
jgi:uncharacterized membrane protein YdjX (TVP38/TMEM64 family)